MLRITLQAIFIAVSAQQPYVGDAVPLAQSSVPLSIRAEPDLVQNTALAKRTAAVGKANDLRQLGIGNTAVYLVTVKFGQDIVELVVDTGSSDTFCISSDFQCLDDHGRKQDITFCKLGPPCHADGVDRIKDLVLDIHYSDSEHISGTPITADLQVGSFVSRKQRLNLARVGSWKGDGSSSGILGLGLAQTSNYKRSGGKAIDVPYQGIVQKTQTDHTMDMFAITVVGDESKPRGILSFGGVPDVPTFGLTACVPLVDDEGQPTNQPSSWKIMLDKVTFGGRTIASNKVALVDSGTSLILMPAQYIHLIGTEWLTSRNPPSLVLTIGGIDFSIKASDMRFMLGSRAMPAIGASNAGSLSNGELVLGDVFLRNAIALFDHAHHRMLVVSTNPLASTNALKRMNYDLCGKPQLSPGR